MPKLTIRDLFPDTMTIHWHAAEKATANASKHGRLQWNDEDRGIYLATYYRIFEQVAGPDHPAVVRYKSDLLAA